ncbi:biofilm development regulator YmgB/AriR family protein [Serratia marcescens]|uniref:biofilm development regulator YmgB/AriR family protein n=1 Tax=Serratia marcescens TaxID=615 RepID=UPI00356B6516
MNIHYLTDEYSQQLGDMEKILGRCVINLIVRKRTINTTNILSHIVKGMEKTPDNNQFMLYRTALEFVGTLTK